MLGNYREAAQLVATRVVLSSTELVTTATTPVTNAGTCKLVFVRSVKHPVFSTVTALIPRDCVTLHVPTEARDCVCLLLGG
jgi:hypothetical protein